MGIEINDGGSGDTLHSLKQKLPRAGEGRGKDHTGQRTQPCRGSQLARGWAEACTCLWEIRPPGRALGSCVALEKPVCVFREGSLEGHVLCPEGPEVRRLRELALRDSSGFPGKCWGAERGTPLKAVPGTSFCHLRLPTGPSPKASSSEKPSFPSPTLQEGLLASPSPNDQGLLTCPSSPLVPVPCGDRSHGAHANPEHEATRGC